MYDFNKKRNQKVVAIVIIVVIAADARDNICVKSCIAFLEIWKKYDNMI